MGSISYVLASHMSALLLRRSISVIRNSLSSDASHMYITHVRSWEPHSKRVSSRAGAGFALLFPALPIIFPTLNPMVPAQHRRRARRPAPRLSAQHSSVRAAKVPHSHLVAPPVLNGHASSLPPY